MRQSTDFVTAVYVASLRLYPPRFRAEYADEMEQVFTQAVAEAEGDSSVVIGLLLAEMRDLPISVVQAHLRERRRYQLAGDGGTMMFQRLYSPRLFQLCAYAILALVIVYALSVISAYFVFDIQTHSPQNAYEWWYSIEQNPAFIVRQLPIGVFLFCFYLLFIPALFLFGGILGLNLWRRWYQLTTRQRRLGMLAAGAILLMLLLTVFTPAWEIGGLWFYD